MNIKHLPFFLLASVFASHVRVSSWNILADFFDKPEYPDHHWSVRRPFVLQTIHDRNPDILGLQEMSPEQVAEMARIPGYDLYTLCQHEEGIPVGTIAKGLEVEAWIGKRAGTPLTAILYKTELFECLDRGRFWFNPEPNVLPKFKDRGQTDKGFGNMNTNRAVLWVKLRHLATGQLVFVFNSHYPLDGTKATRLGCSSVEREQIQDISGDNLWFSMGDRNTIGKAGAEQVEQVAPLFRDAFNGVSEAFANHEGFTHTWAGFPFDRFTNPIVNGKFPEVPDRLDYLFSSIPSACSAHILPVYNPKTGELHYNPDILEESRFFASDHIMVEADYDI